MPEYVLGGMHRPEFRELDEFTQGYVQALFFSEHAPNADYERFGKNGNAMPEDAEGSIPGDAGFTDLSAEFLAKIKADCERFQAKNYELLRASYECDGYDAERAGMDFWCSRNGHGVGYSDREELGELADALQTAADAFGQTYVYVGDDGKIYA